MHWGFNSWDFVTLGKWSVEWVFSPFLPVTLIALVLACRVTRAPASDGRSFHIL